MRPEVMDGLQLMAVGMVTVFIALGLVAALGHGLILAINRWAPAPPPPAYLESQSGFSPSTPASETDTAKLAVILAAVEAATGGRGRVVEITQISHPESRISHPESK